MIGFGLAIGILAILGVRMAAIPDSSFELDGNATKEVNDDWVSPTYVGSSIAQAFVVDGSGNKTIFTGGGSKDISDVSAWAWKDNLGGLPDKDNITNAYARAYFDNNQLKIMFGADRFANDGDAQMGFWFFQSKVQAINGKFVGSDGTTAATHQVGDILVLANLTNGGAVVTIQVFKWVGGKDPLLLLADDLDARCGTNTDPNACAISNDAVTIAPWSYVPKTVDPQNPGTFPQFSFIEGGINVSALLGGQTECFSSFLAETRSSQSPTATLKDFALGGFETCKLDISKTCPTATFNAATGKIDYGYSIKVENKGFGTAYDITVVDTASGGYTKTFAKFNLAGGLSTTLSDVFSLTPGPTTPNPPTNNASLTAATTPGGPQSLSAGPATATCPQLSYSGALTVTKACDTRLEVQNSRVVVAVDIKGQVCAANDTSGGQIAESIDDIVVTDTPAITPITIGSLQPGACANYSATYFPGALIGNSGLPHDQTYEDTVSVAGTLHITNKKVVNTATATCPLCK